MELNRYNAYELSSMLKDKKISSVELTESVFSRIEEKEEKICAYVTLDKENALEQAKAVDNKRINGEELSSLAGIPIGIKDNISTKNLKTTCSSKMLENYVPPFDATVVSRIRANDMVITGKLNMDEFAMGSSTETSYFKKTKNPHNIERIPGGSSGGSVAAVSSCEAVISLGSDTGGSIRQPAACCGVVGLKPTYGSVSRYGLIAFASSLDQIGPIGRCVKDVAMLQNVISGYDRMDATSSPVDRKICEDLNSDVKCLKIGIPKEYFSDLISPDVRELVMKSIKELEKRGAILKEISLPSTDYALSSYYIISSAEASSNLARFDGVKYGFRASDYTSLTDMYEKTRSEGFGDEVKRRIMLGTFVLSSGYYDAYYNKAKKLQHRIGAEFDSAFCDVDVIATPTTPFTAFKLGEKINDPLAMYASDICTVTVNIAGLPALSVPCGLGKDNLPAGIQFIGKKFDEQTILNTGFALESIIGQAPIPNID